MTPAKHLVPVIQPNKCAASSLTPAKCQGTGIVVKQNYDLRTPLEDKLDGAGKFGWTAYVNRTGTIVHLVKAGAPFLVRLVPRPTLKGVSTSYAVKVIQSMVGGHLV